MDIQNTDLQISTSSVFLLQTAARKWQKELQHSLKAHKLGYMEFVLLTALVEEGQQGSFNQKLLAEATGVDKMVVSQTLKTLQSKKIVALQQVKADKRSILIKPLQKASDLYVVIAGDIIVINARLSDQLEHDVSYFEYALKSITD